jgi:GrpB-like predicted nucleotidyltransferase (UPF0157 family)
VTLIDEYREHVARLIPEAEVFLTGSALIEGLGADDLDLVVLVLDVTDAASRLRELYPTLYEDEWREDWAAFRDPGPPQVDLVVTRRGTKGDAHHRRAWEFLAKEPELLAEYRVLKMDRCDYERRKAAFFECVVALMEATETRR